jgi:hypothetical protein
MMVPLSAGAKDRRRDRGAALELLGLGTLSDEERMKRLGEVRGSNMLTQSSVSNRSLPRFNSEVEDQYMFRNLQFS